MVPILAINTSGVVTKANAPARRVLGPVPDGFEGLNLGSVLVQLLDRWKGERRRTLLSLLGDHADREDVLIVLSDGEEARRAPVPSDAVTAAAAPRHSKEADYLAHELRNPLGTILGLAQILESRLSSLTWEDRTMAIRTIQSEAERALLILEGLLSLAGARSRSQPQVTDVPLHAVLRRVIADHVRRNPHRSISIYGDSPIFARANSLWVELAMGNLLTNAEKYTPKDRTIEVALHQSGSNAIILVLDNGSGIPPELYGSLWDIYTHGPEPEVLVRGSGIGLALCKELIESMEGHVWAGPRKAGGSVFAISLPAPWDMAVPPPLSTPISRAETVTGPHRPVPAWN